MLHFTGNLRIQFGDTRLWLVFDECCLWSLYTMVDVEIWSIEDGTLVDIPGSLRVAGLDIDCRTIGMKRPEMEALAQWLRRRLPTPFDVSLDPSRARVTWQAHRGPLVKVS
jgi:hypothetical protein